MYIPNIIAIHPLVVDKKCQPHEGATEKGHQPITKVSIVWETWRSVQNVARVALTILLVIGDDVTLYSSTTLFLIQAEKCYRKQYVSYYMLYYSVQ